MLSQSPTPLTPIPIKRFRPRRAIESDDEQSIHEVPAKRSRKAKKKRKPERKKIIYDTSEDEMVEDEMVDDELIEDEMVEICVSIETSTEAVKPKAWNTENRNNLERAFRTYNPFTNRDWENVAKALDANWTVEELKEQAHKMKLEPLTIASPSPIKGNSATLKKLFADEKVPRKGTMKREALKDAVMDVLYVRRNKREENVLSTSLDDSGDTFIAAAVREFALDELPRPSSPVSKRAFYPRLASSLMESEEIGDDFSISCRDNERYPLKYRAQQYKQRYRNMPAIPEQDEDDLNSVSEFDQSAEESDHTMDCD